MLISNYNVVNIIGGGRLAKKKISEKKSKEYLVLHRNIEDYKIFDIRSNRPISYVENPLDPNSGRMVVQEIDKLELSRQPVRNPNSLEYFAPNNIAMLLSVMDKSLEAAKKIYLENLNPDKFNHSEDYKIFKGDKKDKLYSNSKILYDYIEQIQIAIVFGYTALEAFTNISIPTNYTYTTEKNSKGIQEIFDKNSIERWLSLKIKISEILTDIYEIEDIKKRSFWSDFLQLEQMRQDIIHQKSVQETDFYKLYLKKNIFEICAVPKYLIQYFYDNLEKKNRTNPIWPWLMGRELTLPVTSDFNSKDFEIIGNSYEGRKK